MTKPETRIQHRATCPICFRDHAVRGTTMVQHGYQRPEGWHANVGECGGTNRPHFGTALGRVIAEKNAAFIREWAETRRADAATWRANPPAKVTVNGKYLPKERKYEQIEVDASDYRFERELESMIYSLEQDARHADASAATIEKRVREWKPVAPRPEKVATGPTLHAVNAYLLTKGRTVALCSSFSYSGRGAYKQTTKDRAAVNCKACLKSLASIDADRAVSEKADALIAEMVAKYGEKVREQFSDANDKAIREIRYHRKDVDKVIRKRATDRLERGVS